MYLFQPGEIENKSITLQERSNHVDYKNDSILMRFNKTYDNISNIEENENYEIEKEINISSSTYPSHKKKKKIRLSYIERYIHRCTYRDIFYIYFY